MVELLATSAALGFLLGAFDQFKLLLLACLGLIAAQVARAVVSPDPVLSVFGALALALLVIQAAFLAGAYGRARISDQRGDREP